MKKQLASSLAVAFSAVLVWSCNQSDPDPKGDYVSGVFVSNEGNFSQNNGSVSFFPRERNTADADIFAAANGTALQGGVQDFVAADGKGILLVDNSVAGQDKVVFVDSYTFKSEASIGAPDIENPREAVITGSKAYVSCWGTNADLKYTTGYIAVIDLATKKVTKKINVADGPENLVYSNGKLFVGSTPWGAGNKLTIINTTTEEAGSPIATQGAANPVGLDANGKLWVNANDKVLRINTETNATETTLAIATEGFKSPGNFTFSTDLRSIFFVLSWFDSNGRELGATYKFGIGDAQIAMTTPLIPRVFTGLAVDPTQGLLYAGVTPSYAQAGYAIRYRTDGSVVDSIKVGVAPTGFFFQ
ncbi:hypothetical protein LZD49_18000 [Dyadobacter sp. CY261]|uniref:YncE family protein n=1 Tax=Dyadobacter sp. CY261 TaxID=2907203 RepID=UPI001F2B0C36|nr:DUF5074 domain-containing protein [Dyadobacter sp. CY261]MCF0072380.1 hypothetical protein [Dyadobacter sp. CY261]